VRYRIVDFLGFTPLSHRPPLPRRWWVYCAVAFLAPSLMLTVVPASDVPYRDLIWLLTLVPAYMLSLHYGLRGAVAGLAMGTVLFTVIQFLVAWSLDAEDWRITVPIYTAYGAIAISVGWLSEQLHLFYERAIQGERVAVIGQVAVAIRHEVNNALATILAEGQMLERDARLTHPEDLESVRNIMIMTRRIRDSVNKLTSMTQAPVVEYAQGVKMIDLGKLLGTDRAQDDVAQRREKGGGGDRQ
jgi:signal transduction histidine kinase